jgi:hypothetical protein
MGKGLYMKELSKVELSAFLTEPEDWKSQERKTKKSCDFKTLASPSCSEGLRQLLP